MIEIPTSSRSVLLTGDSRRHNNPAEVKAAELTKLRPGALPMLEWIVQNDQGTVYDLLRKLKHESHTDSLRHLFNRTHDYHPEYVQYLDQCLDALDQIGAMRMKQPIVLQDKPQLRISHYQKVSEFHDRHLESFPKEIPLPLDKLWNNMRVTRREVGPENQKKQCTFIELDISLKDMLSASPNATGKELQLAKNAERFLQLYFEYKTGFASDMPLRIILQVPPELEAQINQLSAADIQGKPLQLGQDLISPNGLSSQNLEQISLSTESAKDFVNRQLRIQELFTNAQSVFFKAHGWTGSLETTLQPQFFDNLAAFGPQAIGIAATGLGNNGTFLKLLHPEQVKIPGTEDFTQDRSTQPEHYAKQIMLALDMLRCWDKKLIVSGHSMGGAAMFWVADEIIRRAHNNTNDELPDVTIIAENPALKGTNVFLHGASGLVVDAGRISHALKLSRLAPKLVQLVSEKFGQANAGEAYAADAVKIHARNSSDPKNALATSLQTRGLLEQNDLSPEMIQRINRSNLPFIIIDAISDKFTNNHEQWNKYVQYGFTVPVLTFPDGHFTHLSPAYQVFMQKFAPIVEVLSRENILQFLNSFKRFLPITEEYSPSHLKTRVNRRDPQWPDHEWPFGGVEDWQKEIQVLVANCNIPKSIRSEAEELAMEFFGKAVFPAINIEDLPDGDPTKAFFEPILVKHGEPIPKDKLQQVLKSNRVLVWADNSQV